MDEFLDTLWFTILAGIDLLFDLVSRIVAPLNVLGPALLIFLIVLAVVALSKTLARHYTTRRYQKLKENYDHWFELRQTALASEDREKGKALAKNIDQAELNKAYYDYFFEGFLKNILTTILPFLLTATYVIRAYKPENLMKTFGQPHIFRFMDTSGNPVIIGALFWFVICMLLVHILWFFCARLYKKQFGVKKRSEKP